MARDALDGTELSHWSAGGAVASLAWDLFGQRLLAGRAEGGTVQAYDLAGYLTQNGPRAPPPAGASWATALGSVDQLVATDDGATILARGPDHIARLDPAARRSAPPSRSRPAASPTSRRSRARPRTCSRPTCAPAPSTSSTPRPSTRPPSKEPLQPNSAPVGPVIVQGPADTQIWVPVGAQPGNPGAFPATGGGIAVFGSSFSLIGTTPLPGTPRQIAWEPVVNMVYVTGVTDDGGSPVLWAVEPHGESGGGGQLRSGFSVWDSTALPGEPLAIAVDAVDTGTTDDDAQILVVTAPAASATTGALVGVDTREDAIAWRMAGVAFGASSWGSSTSSPRRCSGVGGSRCWPRSSWRSTA